MRLASESQSSHTGRDAASRSLHRVEVANGVLAHAKRLRWSAARLQSERERRLRELLAWAKEQSPFHAARLTGIDIEHFTEAQLGSLPVMNKADLMSQFDEVVTGSPRLTLGIVEDHLADKMRDEYLFDQFHVVTSSGSSGRRGVYVYNRDEWTTLALMASRGRLGTIGGSPRPPGSATASLLGIDQTHLSRAMHLFLADPSDPIHHFPMTLPVSEQVRGLNALQPELLMAYPSALDLLLREVHAGRLRISPRYVESGGELLLESTRVAVRDVWGAEIDDCWALSEGVFAYPCQSGHAMHIPDDLIIIEPVDAAGRPVAAGEPAAKLYLTNLYNFTEPLIRFEVSDGLTLLDDACPCGSSHRRIVDLSGRSDVAFEYDNGAKAYPRLFTLEFDDQRDVAEFQVRQTKQGVSIAIVTDRPECLAQIRERAVNTLLTVGLTDPEVTVESVQRLERLDSGKLRQFVPLPRATRATGGD